MEEREKLLSFLAYFFGWISGLIIFLIEKKSEFIRFNAIQSIIFSGIWTILRIFIYILIFIPFLGKIISFLISSLINIACFVIWIILLVKSFQGEKFKLPIIGNYAEKYSKI
ncbi:MAG: DUF4870 domain-containing protein [Candidatus Omnitrophica bacterium]|nr:DUF4870 domain-containing protein [Candidatus Omnitrophota bacterium]MCM8807291.1 DUF4870 domain-containing protein [Candidatus Omnitrophota bacterium]